MSVLYFTIKGMCVSNVHLHYQICFKILLDFCNRVLCDFIYEDKRNVETYIFTLSVSFLFEVRVTSCGSYPPYVLSQFFL